LHTNALDESNQSSESKFILEMRKKQMLIFPISDYRLVSAWGQVGMRIRSLPGPGAADLLLTAWSAFLTGHLVSHLFSVHDILNHSKNKRRSF
jgi:hypothetical protein